MIWTGVTASAETETPDAQDTVQAIDAVAGSVRSDALDVSTADVTVAAAGTTVELSGDAEDGVKVESPGGGDLGIGLPFASQADEGIVVDGAVVYDNNNGTTTTPLVQDDGSVQILTTIQESSAPTVYDYRFELEEGASLGIAADGGAAVVGADGVTTAAIAPPWAYDATGAAIPTWYEVSGDTLVQHIQHAGAAYPVVADPEVTSGWLSGTTYWNKAETKSLAQTTLTAVVAACTAAGLAMAGVIGAAVMGAKCAVEGYRLQSAANTAVNSNQCVKMKLYYGTTELTNHGCLIWYLHRRELQVTTHRARPEISGTVYFAPLFRGTRTTIASVMLIGGSLAAVVASLVRPMPWTEATGLVTTGILIWWMFSLQAKDRKARGAEWPW